MPEVMEHFAGCITTRVRRILQGNWSKLTPTLLGERRQIVVNISNSHSISSILEQLYLLGTTKRRVGEYMYETC